MMGGGLFYFGQFSGSYQISILMKIREMSGRIDIEERELFKVYV